MSKTKRVQIGVVGVDSGQLLLCDPCYIASEWDSQDEFKDIRRYRSVADSKKQLSPRVYEYGVDFNSYEDILFDGKSVNDLLKAKKLEEIPTPPSNKFSYGGSCSQTLRKEGGGQLNYKLGHAGAGVAVSAGYGDGQYPVYVEYIDEGMGKRVARVIVEFMGTYTQEYVHKGLKGGKK